MNDNDKPVPTPTTDPNGETPPGAVPLHPPMTQEACENWILLKGQTGERWFEVRILDPEVAEDPTMIALMTTVSEMIFAGIQGMPFTEAEAQRAKESHLAEVPPLVRG